MKAIVNKWWIRKNKSINERLMQSKGEDKEIYNFSTSTESNDILCLVK